MPEPNIHEFNDKLAEVREWLVRIDTKVDYFNEVKLRADQAYEKADQAEEKAEKALAMSMENQSDVADMKANTKWVWGVIIGVAGLAISGIALFL
ncbi:hemolysin XhlA family protein [Bacillus rugosus]|uniref:hemolysin XhlA family protein n=1 Tax=Bacillus rugosus TaxID=2715209 RepID=UPI00141F073A|nr:hemolysin XhlA family protein [Bacillus rugosus]NUF07876.1 hemolysin XhlA family protein [Bacillus rugosus]